MIVQEKPAVQPVPLKQVAVGVLLLNNVSKEIKMAPAPLTTSA